MSAPTKSDTLRALHVPGTPLVLPNAWDAASARLVEAEYTVPHLAQLPMEPPAAMARWVNGRVEIWASTQNPQEARKEAATVLGIDEAHVT